MIVDFGETNCDFGYGVTVMMDTEEAQRFRAALETVLHLAQCHDMMKFDDEEQEACGMLAYLISALEKPR